MRFDVEKTCLCIDGWVNLSPENGGGKATGLSFAKDIKRVAFVIPDGRLGRDMTCLQDRLESPDYCRFPLLFHNAQHVSGITRSAFGIRKLLGHEIFLNLFSFQPFEQKSMVDGFQMTKPHAERRRLLCLAILSAFDGWNGRIREALDQAGLLKILEEINQTHPDQLRQIYFSNPRKMEKTRELWNNSKSLVRQAIHNISLT